MKGKERGTVAMRGNLLPVRGQESLWEEVMISSDLNREEELRTQGARHGRWSM